MSRATEAFVARLVEEIPALQPIRDKHSSERKFLRATTHFAIDAASPDDVKRLREILEEFLETGDPDVAELVNVAVFDVLEKREPRRRSNHPLALRTLVRWNELMGRLGDRLRKKMSRRSWERGHLKSIDWKTWLSRFRRLRVAEKRDDTDEIRIWVHRYHPGYIEIEGLVLRKRGGRFDGWHLPEAPWLTFGLWHRRKRIRPREGWARLWDRMEEAGVFDLQDWGLEGRSRCWYSVECQRLGGYRAYHFIWPEPLDGEWPGAKAFVHLLDLLRSGTGFDSGH